MREHVVGILFADVVLGSFIARRKPALRLRTTNATGGAACVDNNVLINDDFASQMIRNILLVTPWASNCLPVRSNVCTGPF